MSEQQTFQVPNEIFIVVGKQAVQIELLQQQVTAMQNKINTLIEKAEENGVSDSIKKP